MRMRKKKHRELRLAACGGLILDMRRETLDFADIFGRRSGVCLEIGCGKGRFIAEAAARSPDISFLAVEKSADAVVAAAEIVRNRGLDNVRFLICDAALALGALPRGGVSRIYLNFSDPWPGGRHRTRRLTHECFLTAYRGILAPGGELHIKTDNEELYGFSQRELERCGCDIIQAGVIADPLGDPDNIYTEYEARFVEMGAQIRRIRARVR